MNANQPLKYTLSLSLERKLEAREADLLKTIQKWPQMNADSKNLPENIVMLKKMKQFLSLCLFVFKKSWKSNWNLKTVLESGLKPEESI